MLTARIAGRGKLRPVEHPQPVKNYHKQKEMSQETDGVNDEQRKSGSTLAPQADVPIAHSHQDQEIKAPTQQGAYPRLSKRLQGFSPVFEALVALSTVATLALLVVQTYHGRQGIDQTERGIGLTSDALELAQRQFDNEIRKGKEDAETERIRREEAVQQANAALEEARRLNRLTEAQIAQARRQTEIAARAMEEGGIQAHEAAVIAREVFMEEYQTRIKAVGAQINLKKDGTVSAIVRFKNIGKATAQNVRFAGAIATGGPDFDSSFWGGLYGNADGAIIAPNEEWTFIFHPAVLTADEMGRVLRDEASRQEAADERRLYVFGIARPWFDPFKRRFQRLYFCYKMLIMQNTRYFAECHNNNVIEYERTVEEFVRSLDGRQTSPYVDDFWIRQPP